MRSLALSLPLLALLSRGAAQPYVFMQCPAMGTADPISAQVQGISQAYGNVKGVVLVSGDGGNTFWDK